MSRDISQTTAVSGHDPGGWFNTAVLLVVLLMAGAAASAWRYHQVDQRLREAVVEQAALISQSVRPEMVQLLLGSEADLGTPNYDRIKHLLTQGRLLYPHYRFLYLMRRTDAGTVVFLADSEPADSEDYSPPGQEYIEASEILHSAFLDRRPASEGPMTDRWGVWFSAFVPVFHPYSNEPIAVLGADIDASAWRADLWRSTMPPVFVTLVLMLLTLFFIRLRHYLSGRYSRRIHQRWELAVSIVFGVVLTMSLAWALHENESWRRQESFRRVATVQANALQQMLFRIGENYLEGIARLFTSSEFVDRDEFSRYVGFLLNRPYAAAWAWAPVVDDAGRAAFERAVREAGVEGFRIQEAGATGSFGPASARPVHYPLCYIEPHEANRVWLGYDLASDSPSLAAVNEAIRSRLLSASIARPVPHLGGAMVTTVFRPVFHDHNRSEQLAGLAAAFLDMDSVLERAMNSGQSRGDRPIAYAELYELAPGETVFLASSDQRREPRLHRDRRTAENLRSLTDFSVPVYAFGRVYAMLSEPAAGFAHLYPVREGLRAVVVGLLVTGLISALLGVLSNRRARLEEEVVARTADLRKSEESYRGLFNAIRQSIYIQDEQGRFVDVNDGAVEHYGYAREEFIGRTPEFLSAPGRNNLAHVAECFGRAWTGEPQYFEFWGRTRDGKIFPKDVWLSKGTYLGKDVIIAMATDITERKRSEEDNRRLQAQLLQSQKLESIGRLAGGVAHDFNNMLQAIIGNTNLAKNEIPPGAPVAEYLAEIEQSAHRSARLTRQLLAFASRQTIQPRILDLNDTVAGMLKMLQRLIGEDVHLHWKPGPNLWAVKIDPGQIDQILANLAVNARDAINGVGEIVIETSNHTCDPARCIRQCNRCKPCRYVMITVSDNGCGMTDEVREHLFEPFYTTKEAGKGTGLGLATVFGIVQQNDGVIEVDSAPGRGTTFRIMLPMIDTAVPAPAPPAAEATLSGRETILLVEDEAVILQVGMISLQRLGYSVLVASTPAIALRVAAEYPEPIHLLITDVILPDLNGADLARQIVALKPGIRCLFMSGYTADVISSRGILDESVNFIQKPFTIPDLAAKIRQVLDGPA